MTTNSNDNPVWPEFITLGICFAFLAVIMNILRLIYSIIKTCIGLLILSAGKSLIPNFIRSAFIRIVPPFISSIISPLILLSIGELVRYLNARDHVLILRKQKSDEENEQTAGTVNSRMAEFGVSTQTFLDKYEREMNEIPLQSAIGITGATIMLTAIAPTGIIATATVTNLGIVMGGAAHAALTYSYNYMRGISNTPELDAFANIIQNYPQNGDVANASTTAVPTIQIAQIDDPSDSETDEDINAKIMRSAAFQVD